MRRALVALILLFLAIPLAAQDAQIRTGTNLGQEKVRLATADFKAVSGEANTNDLLSTFNTVLWNDLQNAGIFDMVSKSFFPLSQPSKPQEVVLDAWANPPVNAAMLAFGNLGVSAGKQTVQGWLYDVKNTQSPQVLGKQYTEDATTDNARKIAHEFADEIIFRLGGGIPGIAESKIYFISNRTGHKEVWVMDYDGANQRQVTHLGSITLSPRASPDGSRVAFTSFAHGPSEIMMFSNELNRVVSFPRFEGTNISPAWSPDGTKLAFSSSMRGDPEVFIIDATGANLKRLTNYRGADVSPTWNPKTGAQIAWVSGRTGLPQIFMMETDGTNVQQMTDGGYAVSPSWSPNGQYLVFAWDRKHGPGDQGHQGIYLMEVATRKWVQLTHEGGTNDFPSWSPDNRHIVFQSTRSGSEQIWEMLADGSEQHQLTTTGSNSMPNWSFH